jgi:hypothetical protein
MDAAAAPDAYLVYVWIRDIHPLLWRRLLVRADSTLADLHWVFQIASASLRFRSRLATTPARLRGRMESLPPLLQSSFIPCNMPVYPGALSALI